MKVFRCKEEAQKDNKFPLSFDELKESEDGVYESNASLNPSSRLIVLRRYNRKDPIVLYYACDDGLVVATGWDDYRFRRTDEVVCMEIKAKATV